MNESKEGNERGRGGAAARILRRKEETDSCPGRDVVRPRYVITTPAAAPRVIPGSVLQGSSLVLLVLEKVYHRVLSHRAPRATHTGPGHYRALRARRDDARWPR